MDAIAAKEMALDLISRNGLADWKFRFSSTRYALGSCHYGKNLISISKPYVLVNNEEVVRNTILHEIAHALAGQGHGHDNYWRKICLGIGGSPDRTCADAVRPVGKYSAMCISCGKVHYKERKPRKGYIYLCKCSNMILVYKTVT